MGGPTGTRVCLLSKKPRCLSSYNIPEDGGCNWGSFFFPVNSSAITYLITLPRADASVLTTQR